MLHGPAQRMLDHAAVMLLTAAAAWKFCENFYLKPRGERIEKNLSGSATWERLRSISAHNHLLGFK